MPRSMSPGRTHRRVVSLVLAWVWLLPLAAALSFAATCRSRGPEIPSSAPVAAPTTLPAPTGPYSVGTLTLSGVPVGLE